LPFTNAHSRPPPPHTHTHTYTRTHIHIRTSTKEWQAAKTRCADAGARCGDTSAQLPLFLLLLLLLLLLLVLWEGATTSPRSVRCSVVRVPVLSKRQVSTVPASGMRKGSVQSIWIEGGKGGFGGSGVD
jgi:hypothetical protein